MVKSVGISILLLAVLGLLFACSSSGEGGREVSIVQADDGCSPKTVGVKTGEKLNLVVKNESGKDYEIEGIDGTKLEEVVVPEGRTRSVGYTVPGKAGVYKLKCYVPGDVTTIIELQAEGEPQSGVAPAAGDQVSSEPDGETADVTVRVVLNEFNVLPDKTSVRAGSVRFDADNVSTYMVHELAVLRIKDDGSLANLGEIEDLPFGASGALTLEMEPGRYRLACLIAEGEAGSTVDHYKAGMHTEFAVEP
ncbi:MAG: cupredoxin domain-containing protein [Dehalococcoidia bacterium]|nr:cupredoxin domain-containing protein [Dehalococcoidia bacterium]